MDRTFSRSGAAKLAGQWAAFRARVASTLGAPNCQSLAPGNQPVTETWELINLAREDHNFHIHQTKFQVLSGAASSSGRGAWMDNVPVPSGGDGCDGSVATWRTGACTVHPVRVAIPFTQLGDFVYHCHILEHEDGGMMAHIRVVASP